MPSTDRLRCGGVGGAVPGAGIGVVADGDGLALVFHLSHPAFHGLAVGSAVGDGLLGGTLGGTFGVAESDAAAAFGIVAELVEQGVPFGFRSEVDGSGGLFGHRVDDITLVACFFFVFVAGRKGKDGCQQGEKFDGFHVVFLYSLNPIRVVIMMGVISPRRKFCFPSVKSAGYGWVLTL